MHGTAAHGSTPWLGDNAILKAHDVFRRIETLPFSRESSDLFDRPSISLNGIIGGDAFNKVPDRCEIDVDIRYLPNQEPEAILDQIRAIGDLDILKCFTRAPAIVPRTNPYVLALRDAVGRSVGGDALSVGRDGASDAVSFLEAGVPAVEFGPIGGGHHGPDEWVSVASLHALSAGARRVRRPAAPPSERQRRRRPSRSRGFYTARPVTAWPEADGPPPRPGRRMLLRFALGSVAIVLLGAAVVTTALRLEINETVQAFVRETIPIRGVQNVLDDVEAGKPQTILVLGSDKRYKDDARRTARGRTR